MHLVSSSICPPGASRRRATHSRRPFTAGLLDRRAPVCDWRNTVVAEARPAAKQFGSFPRAFAVRSEGNLPQLRHRSPFSLADPIGRCFRRSQASEGRTPRVRLVVELLNDKLYNKIHSKSTTDRKVYNKSATNTQPAIQRVQALADISRSALRICSI